MTECPHNYEFINLVDEGIILLKHRKFIFTENVLFMSFYDTIYIEKKNKKMLFCNNLFDFFTEHRYEYSYIVIQNKFYKQENIINDINIFFKLMDDLSSITDNIQQISANITAKNETPFLFIFITKRNMYRMPNTNIIEFIFKLNRSSNSSSNNKINLEDSLFVGANAGRYKTDLFPGDKGIVDRAFAYNNNMDFITPEYLFLNLNLERKWSWKENIVEKYIGSSDYDKIESEVKINEGCSEFKGNKFITFSSIFIKELSAKIYRNKFLENINTFILVGGALCSGKTFFAKSLKNFLMTDPELNLKIKKPIKVELYDINDLELDFSAVFTRNYYGAKYKPNKKFMEIDIYVNHNFDNLYSIFDKLNEKKELANEYNFDNYRNIFLKNNKTVENPPEHPYIIYINIDTPLELCLFFEKVKLQVSDNILITQYPNKVIENSYNKISKTESFFKMKNYLNYRNEIILYKELFYKYG